MLGTLFIVKNNVDNDDYYYDDSYYSDDNCYYETYEDSYYTDSYSYSSNPNDVVGIWSNGEGTIAIYDTGYAEISAGNDSMACSWSASDTMITFIPYNTLECEPVTMSYGISGNTASFTFEGATEVFYRY